MLRLPSLALLLCMPALPLSAYAQADSRPNILFIGWGWWARRRRRRA